MITQPRDREVICHASAWDVDNLNDLRVKMCIQITQEDFVTIHHELGHNFYQRAYNTQPVLFQNSANDGFHEAVGDTIAPVFNWRSRNSTPARASTTSPTTRQSTPAAIRSSARS